jgi:hypothetical protein
MSKKNKFNLYFDVLDSFVNDDLNNILENVEFLNIDLRAKQILLLENYSHFIVNKTKSKPNVRLKLGSNVFNKTFDYYNDLCTKNLLKKNFKIISTRAKKTPFSYSIDFSHQLDLWQENLFDLKLNHIEFKKIIFFYIFSVRNQKNALIEEYWNLYLLRLDLELQKKKLKRQRIAIVESHLSKNIKFINYHELLQTLIDLKLQMNIYKGNVTLYQKKIDYFIKKNRLQFYNKRIKESLFKFKGLNLKSIWNLFTITKNFWSYKDVYFRSKEKFKKNFELSLLKSYVNFRRSLVKKFPHLDFICSFERDYLEDGLVFTNVKNKLTRAIHFPKDNFSIGARFFLNIFDNSYIFNEKNFYKNKINSTITDYSNKLFLNISEFRFLIKKLCLLNEEIFIIKKKLLISAKALLFFKRRGLMKFRDFEIICFQTSLTLKKKIFEYVKLILFLNLNS